jgi:hypothetical protein
MDTFTLTAESIQGSDLECFLGRLSQEDLEKHQETLRDAKSFLESKSWLMDSYEGWRDAIAHAW